MQNVVVNGKKYKSNCYLDWPDVFKTDTVVELTLSDDVNLGCGEDGLPPSLSTGGFD